MKWFLVYVTVFASAACDQAYDPANDVISSGSLPSIDRAPYASVAEINAPTVKVLENMGYAQVDYFPVGCIIPDQPAAACDATGAVFMDRREFDNADVAIKGEDYNQYQYVCPAIAGKDIDDWRCREQVSNHS